MDLETPPRCKKHDFSSSEEDLPNRAVQSPPVQTRRRLGLVSNSIRRRLSFSECPSTSEKEKPMASKKNTPKKYKKNKAADGFNDSGISSAGTSPASLESYTQYRWRQFSPELTCSSDSDESLKDFPEEIDLPKIRRGCAGQKRGRKTAADARNATPLRGGKRKKTETIVTKNPVRGPGKRKQEKANEASESPAHKITRQTSSSRGECSHTEEPLDGRALGETAEMSDLSGLDMDIETGLHL